MARDLAVWRQLVHADHAPLRDAAAAIDPSDVTALARLRQRWPKPMLDAAIALAAGRRKAEAKFPARAEALIADGEGVEQATAMPVARYKAQRLARVCGHPANNSVLDLACGIGGDAMALAEAGLPTLAIDRDPVRAWMASRNAECPAAACDIETLAVGGRLCHLDPSRRGEAGRSRRLAESTPGPAVIERIERAAAGLALKLSPAIDPAELPWPGELEFISDQGRLVQAVLWTKALASGDEPTAPTRRATRLNEAGSAVTLAGQPAPPPIGPVGRYLFTIDPAVERAGLIHALCDEASLIAPHSKLGLLTGDHPTDSPWLVGFELVAQMPWRLKRVRQWLGEHDGGLVEVKTRGQAIDPDRAQKQLRGNGDTPYTIFILRWDQTRIALITRRLSRRD
jgi:hypothetical protein